MYDQIPPDVNQKKVLAGIMGIILGSAAKEHIPCVTAANAEGRNSTLFTSIGSNTK